MSLTSLQPGPTDNQIIAGGIFENQDAVLIVPKTIAQCRFAGCVFHGQDTVQGCCYQLLPVNSRLLAVSYAGKIPLCFRWQEFHLPNARAETVCSLSSDVSSRRSLHRHCGANRIISIAGGIFPNGAADETRTRNIHLGRVALYQLNYCRINKMPFCTEENWLFGILEADTSGRGCCRHLSRCIWFGGNRTHICPETGAHTNTGRQTQRLLLASCRAPGRNRTFVRRLTAARSAIEPPEHIEQRGETRHPFVEGRIRTFRHSA